MKPKLNKDQRFQEQIVPEIELLYRIAWNLTRSSTDAEDLVQETLLKAYKALDRFDGKYPRAWLLTILRNTNINTGRKKKPELLKDPDYTFETAEHSDPDSPESLVVDPLFDAELEMAFNALSDQFKQVIESVDLQGRSYAETAERLEIPLGTVMSRLHRARNQIKKSLEDLEAAQSEES